MELKGAYLILFLLCFIHITIQQGPPKKKPQPTKKADTVNPKMIEDLKEQIDNIWQEVSLLKEKQALQTVCLKGIKIYKKCLLAFPEQKTYHEASEHCISLGGTLSTPRSTDENDSIYDYVQKAVGTVDEVWIGVNDMNKEGTWMDMAGAAIGFRNWETEITTQPDGKTLENCAALSGAANGKWFDANCRVQKPFVCEFNIV